MLLCQLWQRTSSDNPGLLLAVVQGTNRFPIGRKDLTRMDIPNVVRAHRPLFYRYRVGSRAHSRNSANLIHKSRATIALQIKHSHYSCALLRCLIVRHSLKSVCKSIDVELLERQIPHR
jgi:hypothetical protein